MTSMQPSPAYGDDPRGPRVLVFALAGSYAAGYSAALGIGSSVTGGRIDAGQAAVLTLAQGVVAALCWVFEGRRKP